MPLVKGSSPAAISANISELSHHGSRPRPHKQIVAIALHEADKYKRRAGGGGGLSTTMLPAPARQAQRDLSHDEYHDKGLFKSDVAGRTDRIPRAVAADSFVMPADVVSGLGSGNTLAGAKIMDGITHSGPYGTKLPHPPALRRADGGGTPGLSHVMVAGGEYLIHRDDLIRIGARLRKAKMSKARSDLAAGHQWAREFVDKVRSHTKAFLRNAPSPKK